MFSQQKTPYTPNNNSHNRSTPALDKYERFEQWLRENGANFDMVSFTAVYQMY